MRSMRGVAYGRAVTLSLGYFARAFEAAESRAAVRMMGTRIHKVRPQTAPGPLLSNVHPPLERTSIFAAAFRSSDVIVVGINVALTRWIRRVAFLGTAARARPCGRAFFMFRFLARGSTGTDVSFTRRAGRGLALSRRNKRRAKERRNNKSRDCKFGSHKEGLPKVTVWTRNWWQTIEF
jgi:hypothetical protein